MSECVSSHLLPRKSPGCLPNLKGDCCHESLLEQTFKGNAFIPIPILNIKHMGGIAMVSIRNFRWDSTDLFPRVLGVSDPEQAEMTQGYSGPHAHSPSEPFAALNMIVREKRNNLGITIYVHVEVPPKCGRVPLLIYGLQHHSKAPRNRLS